MTRALHLSNWINWAERCKLPESSGVYIIAKDNTTNVIYIGRTWGDKGIRKRIQFFNRSATKGSSGHSGAETYYKKIGNDVSNLFVCYHLPIAVNPDVKILKPYIEYAERRLIWEHVEKFGQLPICNSE